MKKLRMRADELKVDSFRTEDPRAPRPGTVRAHDDGCTWIDSCLCETAYYWCGTGPETIHSCDYTFDERCLRTAVDCRDTSYDVCGTRAITPAC
jgi:hypothetical protein